jgi:hypothetical protein
MMSDPKELARERIRPLMHKEAKAGKIRRFVDFWTSTNPADKGPAALEWGIPTVAGGAELGRSEYYRRNENEAQRKLLEDAKKTYVGKGEGKLGWSEEAWADAISGAPKTDDGKKILKGLKDVRGYTGQRDFGLRQALQSALIGTSFSPKYTRAVMKQPGSKAIKYAKDTLDPAAAATWRAQNLNDPMMRLIGGSLSTAGLHQAHRIPGAVESVVSGAESLGPAGKSLETLAGNLEGMAGESDKSFGDIVSNIEEATDPEAFRKAIKSGFTSAAEGVVEGSKKEFAKLSNWAKENPGLAVGGGVGTIGLFAAWKAWKAHQKRKRKEEEAQILAKALRGR